MGLASAGPTSNTAPTWTLHAWIDLPFFVGVDFLEEFDAEYRPDVPMRVQISLRRDLHKVMTGNYWQYEKDLKELIARRKEGEEVVLPPSFTFVRYVSQNELDDEVALLREDSRISYVHVERMWTVLQIVGTFTKPPQTTAPSEFDVDLLPGVEFFTDSVLPRVQKVVDSYRIAVLPAMRYGVLPVSDLLVNQAFMETRDDNGDTVQQVIFGFGHDVFLTARHMYSSHGDRYQIQERFDNASANIGELDPENQFGAAYYLFQLGRSSEAVAIASSVVDGLAREVVFEHSNTTLGRALWRGYRHRYKELFNEVLPGLGLPKLADEDPSLWEAFVEARRFRGVAIHGGPSSPPDEIPTIKHKLGALYGVARWLSTQLGRAWALDHGEAEDSLQSFP